MLLVMWLLTVLVYWHKKRNWLKTKAKDKRNSSIPRDDYGKSTWSPFHFAARRPLWLHVRTLHLSSLFSGFVETRSNCFFFLRENVTVSLICWKFTFDLFSSSPVRILTNSQSDGEWKCVLFHRTRPCDFSKRRGLRFSFYVCVVWRSWKSVSDTSDEILSTTYTNLL